MISKGTQIIPNHNMLNTLKKSGLAVLMAIGLCATAQKPTSQGATTSTLTGQKSTLDTLTLGKLIEFSFTSGKPVKQIHVATECVILKIDVADSLSWRHQKRYIRRLNRVIAGMEFCPKPVQTLRSYSPTRWFLYPPLYPFSLNPYNRVWIDPRLNWHIPYRRLNYPRRTYRVSPKRTRPSSGSIRRSTGRTRATTPMMGRSSNSSSMMNRANGRSRTLSRTTGRLPRRASGSGRK